MKMLVEINLLPKKEHKTSSSLSIVLILLFVFIIVSIGVFVQARINETSLEKVDQEIESVQKLNTALQNKINDQESSHSTGNLQRAVAWAESYTPETVRLLRSLIALLPEQGFIQSLSYNGEGVVGVKVQFESSRDAAYFLSSLKHSEWVDNASILTIAGVKEEGNASASGLNTEAAEVVMPVYYSEFEIHFNREFFTKEYQNDGGRES
jgi:type IV pilus assembly protein PilN